MSGETGCHPLGHPRSSEGVPGIPGDLLSVCQVRVCSLGHLIGPGLGYCNRFCVYIFFSLYVTLMMGPTISMPLGLTLDHSTEIKTNTHILSVDV